MFHGGVSNVKIFQGFCNMLTNYSPERGYQLTFVMCKSDPQWGYGFFGEHFKGILKLSHEAVFLSFFKSYILDRVDVGVSDTIFSSNQGLYK